MHRRYQSRHAATAVPTVGRATSAEMTHSVPVWCCGIVLLFGGCSSDLPNPNANDATENVMGTVATLSTDEADVCEFALRFALLDELSWIEPDQRLFLAVGLSADGKWLDPAPEFLRRMADLSTELQPASEAEIKVIQRVADTDILRVEDPLNGNHCYIHYVTINRWHNDKEVEVTVGTDGGTLSGAGYDMVVEKHGGRWRFKAGTRREFIE